MSLKARPSAFYTYKNTEPLHIGDAAFRFTDDIWVLGKISEYKVRSVVDVGCGPGKCMLFVRNSLKQAIPWHGIDMVDYSAQFQIKNAQFTKYDFEESPPLPPCVRNVECFLCSETLEHLEEHEAEKLVKCMCERLSPGGIIILTAPGPTDFKLKRDAIKWGHFWSPRASVIEKWVRSAKCVVKESWNARFTGSPLRIKQVRDSAAKLGSGAASMVERMVARYGTLVTCTILAHIVDRDSDHVCMVIKKRKGGGSGG